MLRIKNRSLGHSSAICFAFVFAPLVSAGPMSGYVGHTSPHSREIPTENYSRPDKNGKIRPVSLIAQDGPTEPTLLSGSVYYMVYERDDRDPNDPWGTGIPNFIKSFRAGIDFNGGSSPDIDSKAKYLYLYQVVNHRRTLPPIESMSTKLLVELSEITSWGYFHGLGFASKDENQVVRPLSATHKVDARTYLSPAPALPIAQPLALAYVPTSRGEIEPMRDASKIVHVHWDALDPATPPDYTMILGSSDFDKHPSFRAIWSGKNAIGKDGRSTAFGFTSPMPPTIEPVRLRTSRDIAKVAAAAEAKAEADAVVPVKAPVNKANEAVKLARLAESEATPAGETIAGIEGRVPTPYPTSAGLAFDPKRDERSKEGNNAPPLMSTPVAAPTSAGSSIVSGLPFGNSNNSNSSGGGQLVGGISGGTSGGNIIVFGNGATQNTGNATAQAEANSVSNSSIAINFNLTQSNQQSQSQSQMQKQGQSQNQNQGQHQGQSGGGKGNVVPEPATLIGLALGLPALAIAYRRRRGCAPTSN